MNRYLKSRVGHGVKSDRPKPNRSKMFGLGPGGSGRVQQSIIVSYAHDRTRPDRGLNMAKRVD